MDVTPEHLFNLLVMMAETPLLLGLLLAAFTFASEDASLLAGSLLVAGEVMSPFATIAWLVGGIIVGDIILYGMGRVSNRSAFVRRVLSEKRLSKIKGWLQGREVSVLFLTRFMPGMRLPTYLAFGYLKLPFTTFCLTLFVAGSVWVSTMVLFVQQTQALLKELNGPLGLAGALVVAALFLFVFPRMARKHLHAPNLDDPALDGPELDGPELDGPDFEETVSAARKLDTHSAGTQSQVASGKPTACSNTSSTPATHSPDSTAH